MALGASYHKVIKFKLNCYFLTNDTHNQGYIWNRADYQAMKLDSELIHWDHELAGNNMQQMWDKFESKLATLVMKHVLKRKQSKKRFRNNLPMMNDKAYTKVQRKNYNHKRYRTTPVGENYNAYTNARK